MATVTHHRARVAALSRSRTPSDPELVAERDALAFARIEATVARVVAEAPPLTQEQQDRIAALLRSPGRPAEGGAQ